jgi:ankyrin repeat protein
MFKLPDINFNLSKAQLFFPVSLGRGHLKVVKILIRAGANVNHLTKSGSTPLRAACFEGRLDVVKYLIAHGAKVDLCNEFNNSCLMLAAYRGNINVRLQITSLSVFFA